MTKDLHKNDKIDGTVKNIVNGSIKNRTVYKNGELID